MTDTGYVATQPTSNFQQQESKPLTTEFDPWATSSGLVPEFDALVTDSFFAFDPEYNNGETFLLKLDIKSDDPDVGREGDGTDTLLLACGPGWSTEDKGATAVHDSGKPRNFNKNTGYGFFVESAKQVDGLLDVLKSKGAGFDHSAIWKDLNLSFERVTDGEFTTAEGQTKTINRIKIAGIAGGGASTGNGGQAPVQVASAAADVPAAGAYKPEPGIKLKLTTIAKKADSHDAFIEAALVEIPEVSTDEALQGYVTTEANYLTMKG